MNLIDSILNLACLFLWVDWRAGRVSKQPQSALSLANAARPTERRKATGLGSLGVLMLVLIVRPCFYYSIGSKLSWTPQLDLLAVSLPWRSDLLDRMYLYSTITFVLTIGFFYLVLLLLSAIHRAAPPGEVLHQFVRLQLGWLERLPWPLKLVLPSLVAGFLWAAFLPLLAWLQLLPGIPSTAAILGQSAAFALAVLLCWKWILIAVFGVHFVNLYIYLGTHPFWTYISATARTILRPLSLLTFPRFDLAPLAGAALVWLFATFALRPAVIQLFQRFAS